MSDCQRYFRQHQHTHGDPAQRCDHVSDHYCLNMVLLTIQYLLQLAVVVDDGYYNDHDASYDFTLMLMAMMVIN
jgi:hypothetical protein